MRDKNYTEKYQQHS